MTKKQYGDPVLTLRMPRVVITALQKEAAKRQTSVSSILRDLAVQELSQKGYSFAPAPVEGQMQIE